MPLRALDVYESIAPFAGVNGTCAANEDKLLDYLNKVSKMLFVRGDWKGTIEEGCISSVDCAFGLPWHLEEVRNAWYCTQPMLLRDQYYETFAGVGLQTCCGGCCYPQLIKTGKYMAYQKQPPHGWRLAIQGTAIEDEELTFYMTDYTGQRFTETVTPNLDVQKLETSLGNIINVAKPRTKGFVRVLAWHPDHAEYEFVAKFDAHQEAPEFTEYKISGVRSREERSPEIIIRAKRKFIPIRSGTDPLWIDNEVALEFACLAYNYKLTRENAKYAENLNLAEEQLEEVLENAQPKAWTPLQVKYQKQAWSPSATGMLGYRRARPNPGPWLP